MSRRSHAIEPCFQEASHLYLSGRHEQAAHMYHGILADAPNYGSSLHSLTF